MMIVHQPPYSKLCGHCCVSMVTGVPLDGIITLIGHQRGTRTKEIVECLKFLKEPVATKLRRVREKAPDKALLVVRPIYKKGGNWHWVVLYKGVVYDPCLPTPTSYASYLNTHKLKATSYLQIIEE